MTRRVLGCHVGRLPSPIGDYPVIQYRRRAVCYWFFTGWTHLSLGLHVDIVSPNLEVHLPFGFVRVGLVVAYRATSYVRGHAFGIEQVYE